MKWYAWKVTLPMQGIKAGHISVKAQCPEGHKGKLDVLEGKFQLEDKPIKVPESIADYLAKMNRQFSQGVK